MLEKKEIIETLTSNFYSWVDYCAEFKSASESPEAGELDQFFDDFARIMLECYQDGKHSQLKTVFGNIERLSEQCVGNSEEIVEALLNAIRNDWGGSGQHLGTLEGYLGERTLIIWNKNQGESPR
ncbi:MAG TPA: hypothetical protein VJS64_17750 [Pyrinomonadaceae bacterium]|nr:hypothetical protein [Pyrinomonadaceae bacterium]